jgi:prepilin-type processing-associated H-X9-DG protein
MRDLVNALILALISVVVAGLVVPFIANVRQAAARIQCANNLKQTGLATLNFGDQQSCFPRAGRPNPSLAPDRRLSWMVETVPYVEADILYSRIHKETGWDAEENRFAAVMTYNTFQCPGFLDQTPESTLTPSHFIGMAGLGRDAALLPMDDPRAGFFGYDRKLTMKDIAGRTSTLLMAMETSRARGGWTAAGPPTARGLEEGEPYLGSNSQFGGNHRGGVNAVLADGSVRLLEKSMDRRVLEAMVTVKGSGGVEGDGEE